LFVSPLAACRILSKNSGSTFLTYSANQIDFFELAATTVVRNKLINAHGGWSHRDQPPFLLRGDKFTRQSLDRSFDFATARYPRASVQRLHFAAGIGYQG
jgi:hypothetical protein